MVYTSKTQHKKEKLAVEIQMTMSRSQIAADYDALVDKDTAQHAHLCHYERRKCANRERSELTS